MAKILILKDEKIVITKCSLCPLLVEDYQNILLTIKTCCLLPGIIKNEDEICSGCRLPESD
jgi:hypothetical protein